MRKPKPGDSSSHPGQDAVSGGGTARSEGGDSVRCAAGYGILCFGMLPVKRSPLIDQGGCAMIRVLIADDHKVVRQGLRLFLRMDPEIEIVGEAANGAEAVELARQLMPDVVLMDILMPVMDGIAATAAIRKELPEIEVLGLTSVLDEKTIVEIMRAGAIGYLLKDLDGEELCRSLHAAAAGQVQLAP